MNNIKLGLLSVVMLISGFYAPANAMKPVKKESVQQKIARMQREINDLKDQVSLRPWEKEETKKVLPVPPAPVEKKPVSKQSKKVETSGDRLKNLTKLEVDLYWDAKNFPGAMFPGAMREIPANLVKYVEKGGPRPKALTKSEEERFELVPEEHRLFSLSGVERDFYFSAEKTYAKGKQVSIPCQRAFFRYVKEGGPRPEITDFYKGFYDASETWSE